MTKTHEQTGASETGRPSPLTPVQGTSVSQFIKGQSTNSYCTGKPKLHLPRKRKKENTVSGFPWNIQMLVVFISQVIPTSRHLVRRLLTWMIYASALTIWPLSLLVFNGLWCYLMLYILFIKKSKTEQVFSSTSCSVEKWKIKKSLLLLKKPCDNINHREGTNYSDCEQQGTEISKISKPSQRKCSRKGSPC